MQTSSRCVLNRSRFVPAETPREEAPGQARPGEKGDPLRAIPRAPHRASRAADGDAPGPRRLELLGEAEVRAADPERDQAVDGGVLIRLAHPLVGPVRAAEDADLPRPVVLVQHVHDRPDRQRGVVAVQDVDLDLVGVEPPERFVEVVGDVLRGDARTPPFRVCALAEDHDLVAHATVGQPGGEDALLLARAVAVGRIERAAAEFVDRIEERETPGPVGLAERDRPLYQARDRLLDARDPAVFHRHPSTSLIALRDHILHTVNHILHPARSRAPPPGLPSERTRIPPLSARIAIAACSG